MYATLLKSMIFTEKKVIKTKLITQMNPALQGTILLESMTHSTTAQRSSWLPGNKKDISHIMHSRQPSVSDTSKQHN